MLRRFLFVFGFFAIACASATASAWPEATSDLAADPSVRRGTLSNGFRYAIRPNSEPRGRVSLRFIVLAGSLHERDDERGLAHFLEHMVFRGTRTHPDGSMASELQRLGIAFGPDNTAFTHFDHTIYHLDLPDTREATLRHGLSIFREYATEVTFAPGLIERERGVIMSEKHTRDTPDARASLMNMQFLWPEARQVQRNPIGTEEAIRRFTREQFISFYDAWYRPERMAVVIVGDIAPEMAERLVGEVLASIVPRGEPRAEPESFVPSAASKPDIRIFTDPGLVGASCVIQHPLAEPRVADTHARRVQLLHRSLAFAMFQRRITKAAAQTAEASIAPITSLSEALPGWVVASLGGTGRIGNWREFMSDIEQHHRRAFLHGFTAAELQSAKIAFATSYTEAVRTSVTWPSGWIAQQLANSLIEGRVFTTPAIVQADLGVELEAATTAQCLAEFRAAWSRQAPHVFIATHPEFKISAIEIASALNASRAIETPAPAETESVRFAYEEFGAPAWPTREQHVQDLDVHQAEFPNGVRLNFKATDFAANTVTVCLRVGRGKLSQPRTQPGLDLLAEHMVLRGGLGRHPFEEVQDLLNGHTINIGFNVASDAFEFTARCAQEDLLLCLQVITANLTDSAYRPEARRQVDAILGSLYAQLGAAAGGPIWIHAQRIMTGDQRFGIPAYDEVFGRSIEELKAWVEPEFKQGAIELSIVGDTVWDEAKSTVARTLAALPNRARSERRDEAVRMVRPRKAPYVFTTVPQLKQVALAWFSPVSDLGDRRQERRCRMLAELLAERLRVRLREELGATYSCAAVFEQFDGFPFFSYFSIYAEVAPAQAEQAARLMKTELETLRKKQFTDDEFERVKQPFLRHREEDRRNNLYWAYTVLRDAQERPERLVAARDRATDTQAITRREVEKLAARYFKANRIFHFVAYPGVGIGPELSFGD